MRSFTILEPVLGYSLIHQKHFDSNKMFAN